MAVDYAETGETTLAYRIDGDANKPWLILSNSLATDHAMWEPQLDALLPHFRVLRYDTRGHGNSTVPPGPYSFSDLVGDVIGLMDALGIEKASFMGLSLGGMTALGLELDHSHRIDRIICADARADAPEAYKQMWPGMIARARESGMEGPGRADDGAMAERSLPRRQRERGRAPGNRRHDPQDARRGLCGLRRRAGVARLFAAAAGPRRPGAVCRRRTRSGGTARRHARHGRQNTRLGLRGDRRRGPPVEHGASGPF